MKLNLYIKYLKQQDRDRFIIRGLTEEKIEVELAKIDYSLITTVPTGYSLSKLKSLTAVD